MRRSGDDRGRRSRGAFAFLPARLGFWLAALALLSQSLALAAPHMPPADARTAAAELTAALGPGVVVCVQSEAPSAPAHPSNDCDLCPICQLAAAASGLALPTAPAIDAPTARVLSEVEAPSPVAPLPRQVPKFSLARGPPSTT